MRYTKKFMASDYSGCHQFTEIEGYLGYAKNSIWDIEYTVQYSISAYASATFYQEAEGGDMSPVELLDVVVLINYVDSVYGCTDNFLRLPVTESSIMLKEFEEKYLPVDDEFYLKLSE